MPSDSSLLLLCQDNYRSLIKMKGIENNYCQILQSLISDCEPKISTDGLMGFFFPRNSADNKENCDTAILKPTAFYYSSKSGDNNFFVKSYMCAMNINTVKFEDKICDDCNATWRKVRNIAPGKLLKLSDHNRILKNSEKKYQKLMIKSDEIVKDDSVKKALYNRTINKLLKKVSYWRQKCKTLQEAVEEWRKVEATRDGFISIEDDEAQKWLNFYTFIDAQIDLEHYDDEEMKLLHKELIRTETSSLGKFNKRKNKRGITKTKISSRILNYSMSLANKLGKTNYEKESKLHCLPNWSTLTRYVLLFFKTIPNCQEINYDVFD